MSAEDDSPEYIIIPETSHRCKCCFDDRNLKSMWDVYTNDGEEEIYGEMIGECFAISWESHEEGDLICEMCILRLREAITFKRGILATHELLLEAIDIKDVKQETSMTCLDMDTQIKIEEIDYNGSVQENFEDVEYLDDEERKENKEIMREYINKDEKFNETNSDDCLLKEIGSSEQSLFLKEEDFTDDKSPIIQNNSASLESNSLSDESSKLNVTYDEVSHSKSSCNEVKEKLLQHNITEELVPKQGATPDNNDPQTENKANENKTVQKRRSKIGYSDCDKDYCFYCKTFVLNFARHLLRHHMCKTEVQKILTTPKRSVERKKLISALRKKGNYLVNAKEVTKPMRRHKYTNYLPCTDCLGFYSKKLLWRHKKLCSGQKDNRNAQSEAQNLLVRDLKIDKNLKDIVFPRMRADKLSLIAKKDNLICAFGAQYFKSYNEKQHVNVVSRKMRELAKLLIETKKIDPSINDLSDVLRPDKYDVIVQTTKILGKYDIKKDRFERPSFAINIYTTLKQCCNIAMASALKKQGPYMEVDTEIEAELKSLVQLMETNWKNDVSAQAFIDLNRKKLHKVTIVSLANDLKNLIDYLKKKSLDATKKIKEGIPNSETYTELLETVFLRVLLLSRRRPLELQRITLQDYSEENKLSDMCEDSYRLLTFPERILIKKFKPVIVRTKHGHGLFLFNPEVQDDIKLLLSIRNKFFGATRNRFLFGSPGCENTIGYKVLEKHSRLSRAKIPNALFCARLRKHLATLSQLFSMSENDMDQLATFMGYSDVYKKSFLPRDVTQIAKISKLLILMEDGKADAYIGKPLEDIDLDMNEEMDEEVYENDKNSNDCETIVSNSGQICNPNSSSQAGPSSLQKTQDIKVLFYRRNRIYKGTKRTLVPWTTEQKDAVTNFFKSHIKNRQPPKKLECEKVKRIHGNLLDNKDWLKIKVYVQNMYSKSKKYKPLTPEPKRKWPKKKKKSERLARYKQYSADDMRQAIKAVRSGEMTCSIAAITYGVPKKTLTAKTTNKDREDDDAKDSTSEKHYKLIEEIKNILKFTNAIPFKTKTTRYYCAYCSTDGPIFEDGDSLRLHTRLEHDKERLLGVEKFMRPQWMNEIVKLDIEGLHCTTCRVRLPDWNKMFVHFGNAHNIEFDQAYTRVIPYALTSQLRCVLCKEGFHNYGHVDSHMNHHYSNYICHQCGDTFLAASRFDKHLKVHKIGNYPCEMCDKVFTLEKYRTKHKNLVHDQKSMVKCLYCSEKFVGLFQRHVHVTEEHKDKVKVYTCELCGNCYTWKTYFLAHMRRRHGTERKHQCKHCDKSFLMKYELRNHMIKHTDEKFLCGLCGKSFKRMITLKKHCLSHEQFNED